MKKTIDILFNPIYGFMLFLIDLILICIEKPVYDGDWTRWTYLVFFIGIIAIIQVVVGLLKNSDFK